MRPCIDYLENHSKLLAFVLWGIIVALIFIAYWPSLQGPFIFDDIQNIVKNPKVAINDLSFSSLQQAAFSNDRDTLKRLLPGISFGINHYMAGGFSNTLPFKLTNLIVHLINTGLVMRLVFLLFPLLQFPRQLSKLQISLAVAFISFLWALHPLNVSTVAYVVQRMTSMSATFVLLGLCFFVQGRYLLAKNFSRGLITMTLAIIVGALLGVLSKENAVLISCYAAAIEFSLFKRDSFTGKQKWNLTAFYLLFVVIPICAVLYYYFFSTGNLFLRFSNRPFTLTERLWTELRVLWFYLSLISIPDITQMGIFHDDIALSRGWLQPISTLIAAISWLGMLFAAIFLRHKLPALSLAVFWFLAGHSLESSFLPLELVYEHRNYLPSLGIIIFIAYLFIQGFYSLCNKGKIARYIAILLATTLIVGLITTTWHRANYWSSQKNIFYSIGQNHPDSAISQYLYAEVLFKQERQPLKAYPHYFKAAELNPNEVAFLLMAVLTTPVDIMQQQQDPHLKKIFSNKHIVDLILHQRSSPWAFTVFDSAGTCVLSKHQHCLKHINDVSIWLQAVLDSPYMTKQYKVKYRQQLYGIQMMSGQYAGALKTIQRSIAIEGRAFQYYLKQAHTLQALKRYPEALAVLKEAEMGLGGQRPDLLRQVQQMQRGILARQRYQR